MHLTLIAHPHLIQIATDTFAQLLVTDTLDRGRGEEEGTEEKRVDRQTDSKKWKSRATELGSKNIQSESRKGDALRMSVLE